MVKEPITEHDGHHVLVTGGIITCITCDPRVVLDDSGARPGLIAANQER